MKTKEFRKDINGLRAIAVLAVIIFHYNNNWLTGGFSGVDVFFVISGFLMTKIIYSKLDKNNFSLLTFIKHRFARIVPALTAVVFVFLLLGYVFFEPLSYQLMGKHALSSLLFYSNLAYQNEAGYFDIESINKIFLHSWSLSIEWQFYMLYPLMLIVLFKLTKKENIRRIILFFSIILFIVNIINSIYISDKTYFMLSSRAWEMLVGGIAYLYPMRFNSKCKYIELLGVLLIILGYLFLSPTLLWPSFYALIPVIGAFLVISQPKEKSILSNFSFQWIGVLSYSLYLVHWPILVFLNQSNIKINFIFYLLIVLFSSLLLHFSVERKRISSLKMLIVFFIVVGLSFYVSKDGISKRLSNKEFGLSLPNFRGKYEGHIGIGDKEEPYYFNSNENNFDYILIGDSHAKHLYYYIQNSDKKVVSFALDGCKSTKDFYSNYNKKICEPRYSKIIEFINKHPNKKILWSTAWIDRGNGLKQRGTLSTFDLKEQIVSFISDVKGSELFIIGSTPNTGYITYQCLAKKELPINKIIHSISCPTTVKNTISDIDRDIIKLPQMYDNVHYINAAMSICNSTDCTIIDGNTPLFTDTNHLTKHGSSIVGKYIFDEIAKFN
ncbi:MULTISPECIES: acyltransferase family protein [unclassified Providencia]|uniref:acyltransferase family protein n=1 Tax=unclassified Providencia TaxID=2633465 RepID=UPI00140E1439|nr:MULTISPECIES: acyltransferase family protein [unclassified Providencia]